MSINEYLELPIKQRVEIVKDADFKTAPFWLERLQTALINKKRQCCLISKTLLKEYDTIQTYFK